MTTPSPSFVPPRFFYAPRAQVRIAGLALAAELHNHVLSVSYDSNVDMADMFTVVLRNPEQRLTDSPLFDLGKTVDIHMGYGETLEPMMLGEITSLQPSFPASGAPTLTISGYDKSYRLRHNQPDRPAFQYVNDSVIASQIAGENGLIPVVDPSRFRREKIHQTTSDMAFLKDLARQNFTGRVGLVGTRAEPRRPARRLAVDRDGSRARPADQYRLSRGADQTSAGGATGVGRR